MAETTNISKMAEIVSKDIFRILKWEKLKPTNQNWKCVKKQHNKETHPSDVVFTYKEPYKNIRTYINTDLKSYARKSINKGTILTAVNNLALSISCAEVSKEWQTLFKMHSENFQVVGLLFVYNHDGGYDKDFNEIYRQALNEYESIESNQKIYIIGPQDIAYLQTIVNDIQLLKSDEYFTSYNDTGFFYPNLVNKKLYWPGENLSATLDSLLSPFQVFKYRNPKISSLYNYILYYKRPAESIESFIYLIDYILHFQLLGNEFIGSIEIRLPYPSKNAPNLFETAKIEYGSRFQGDKSYSEKLDKITYSSITNITTKFSDIEIGMFHE